MIHRAPILVAVAAACLCAASPATAETHDLHVYGYCSPTSNLCGFGSQAAWNQRVLNSVQEMNEIWKPTGKSFRPILHPIDTGNPNYYNVTGCNSKDDRNPYVCENLTTPCSDDSDCDGILGGTCNVKTVCENLTQSCNQFCPDLLTECDESSDCTGIGDGKCRYSNLCGGIGDGHCLTVNQQQRVRWRKEVGILHPGAVSLMLTEGSNVCCSNIPSSDDPNWAFYGIFCDPARSDFDTGGIWAHEMGHHFCLSHTFSKQDFAETMPNQPNHDGDFGTGVQDTPADPCTQEGDDRDDPQCLDGSACEDDADCGMFNGPCNKNIGMQDKEWCNTQVVNGVVDDESPHGTFCNSTCVRCVNGPCDSAGDYTVLNFDPHEHASMSYYGPKCGGPFVINGIRTEAYSSDSLNKIGACGSNYSQLDKTDVCANRGGDSDSDGICNIDDNCPYDANTDQKNSDNDDHGGDVCDLCPGYPWPTGDIDGDGLGDACDPDIDGDDCLNENDQHPYEGNPVVGHVTYIGCGNDGGPITKPESSDSDFDGVPDCMDLDDDNDGVCDEGGPHPPDPLQGIAEGCEEGPDPCPVNANNFCNFIEPGDPCPPIWPECIGSGCLEFLIKIYELINPDPTEIVFEHVQILNNTLYLSALPGLTPSQSAQALAGNVAGIAQGGAKAPDGERLYRMELWSRRTNERVAVLVERFSPGQVAFGALGRGGAIAVTPTPDQGSTVLRVDVRWAPGGLEDVLPPDRDEDGRPDGHDNCVRHYNPLQEDTDGDGIGDACDADFDNDGVVTGDDLDFLNSCIGVDPDVEAPLSEPDDEELDGFQSPQPAPEILRESLRCAAVDLNGDGVVDDRDMAVGARFEGLPPGPSSGAAGGVTAQSPGRLGGPLLLDKVDGRLLLDWGPRCHDEQDTAIYEGRLGLPGSHTPLICTDPGLDGKELFPLTPGASYYLAVPIREEVEGSFGKDSAGQLRSRGWEPCAPMWIPEDRCVE